jgi:hypothetical protein
MFDHWAKYAVLVMFIIAGVVSSFALAFNLREFGL